MNVKILKKKQMVYASYGSGSRQLVRAIVRVQTWGWQGASSYISDILRIPSMVSGIYIISICKKKVVPLQAWNGPEGSRKLRFPDFMTTAQDGGKVVSLMHRPTLPQEIHLVLSSVRGSVNPRAIVRPEGLCHWKMPITPSWIEPATCWFVA